jgi:hypothetical protein
MNDIAVADALAYQFQKFVMRNGIEILAQICVKYFGFTLLLLISDFRYGLLTDVTELQHKRRRSDCLYIFRPNGKLGGLDFLSITYTESSNWITGTSRHTSIWLYAVFTRTNLKLTIN